MEPNKTINLKTKIIYNNMNEEIKNKIIELKKEGMSIRQIAELLNISKSRVEWNLKNNTIEQDNKTRDTTRQQDTGHETEQDTHNRTTGQNKTNPIEEDIKEDKKEYRTKEGYTIGEDIFIF